MRLKFLVFFLALFLSNASLGQEIEKVIFDTKDSTDGYYLAIRPLSKNIKGVVVLFNSFSTPERMLPETKLQNVAYANDLLTIAVSMKQKLYADTATVERLNTILQHVVAGFKADTSKFVLAGYDFAGNIALRYAELSHERSSRFHVRPKAVIAIDSPVDVFGLWRWCERQIKKNTRSSGDARYIIDLMTREHGSIQNRLEEYKKLTPFYLSSEEPGNEQHLKNVPVRLYYDVDIEWDLKANRKSLYDTNIPDGSELISRLGDLGNKNAELITAKKPGMNSRGIRTTNSLSIVDEVECVHWIKNKLDIFDPHTWIAPYQISSTDGWGIERFPIPIEFAPQIPYHGVEDVRFAPGWGDQKSEGYWSYTYLWWLDGEQRIDAGALQEHLQSYYAGLVGRNISQRKIPANKVIPTRVKITTLKPGQEYPGKYSGTINMLDYMTQQPIVLNFVAQVRNCSSQNHTAVFIEISPKPYEHEIWKSLNRIVETFECAKQD